MKNRRYLILICSFVGAAVFVGGFFWVRWWLRPEIWINISHVGSFVLTNDRGETLVWDHGDFSGTMEILDFQGGMGVDRYGVSDSDFFTFQPSSSSNYVAFGVERGDDFMVFFFDKAEKVTISQSAVFAEGDITNYQASVLTDAGSTRQYNLCGDSAQWVRLDRAEDAATAESSSGYTFTLSDLRSGEVFAQHNSPDGAAYTLQNDIPETGK